ncbi:Hypothetical protein NTJ_14688 [Nesidiocoris tenuis]|uniref:Uncharacterized protein n=1 Tax=Nesidiocoris tenuis TaxID=355587 RepID=A0ABN7BBW8_9HEMI|nr:Hypothetical protein NTJ_14688 [Nesidiocoris tenuis]
MWQDFEVEGFDGLTAYQPRYNFTVEFEGFQGMWTELSPLRQARLLRRSHSSPNSLTNSQKKKSPARPPVLRRLQLAKSRSQEDVGAFVKRWRVEYLLYSCTVGYKYENRVAVWNCPLNASQNSKTPGGSCANRVDNPADDFLHQVESNRFPSN